MDHIPTPRRIDRDKEIEAQMQLKHIQDRARAASPLDTGHDILKTPTLGSNF